MSHYAFGKVVMYMTNKGDDSLTLAASQIFITAAEISGPMPSPGIKVTVCTYAKSQIVHLRNIGIHHRSFTSVLVKTKIVARTENNQLPKSL